MKFRPQGLGVGEAQGGISLLGIGNPGLNSGGQAW